MANQQVKYGNSTNEYVLYETTFNGTTYRICGKFNNWSGNTASGIEITKNEINQLEILSIEFRNQPDCNEGACNELQVKAKIGTNNTGQFIIPSNCDFQNTVVIGLVFSATEIAGGLHNRALCSNCYMASELSPDVKNGNILVGKN